MHRIEYMPIDGIQPALRNPKLHDMDYMTGSVAAFGWLDPQLLDERTGRLVGGHGRLEWLKQRRAAGYDPPEGIQVDAAGNWCAPVVLGWASTDDDHALAAGITLNRGPARGGWDLEELTLALDDLANLDHDLAAATGFTDADLDDLQAQLGDMEVLDAQATEADYAEHGGRGDPAPPRTEQGLREVGLMFHVEHHREYVALLAQLRQKFSEDSAPMVVLRAMRLANDVG